MTENSILTSLVKMKAFGYFLVFWGLTFILRAICDLEYYIFNWGSDTSVEAMSWIFYDVVSVVAGILIIIVAIKILKSKN
jgi:hypothetical protein